MKCKTYLIELVANWMVQNNKMKFKTQQHKLSKIKQRKKRTLKNEKITSDIWHNFKDPNLHIIGISEVARPQKYLKNHCKFF